MLSTFDAIGLSISDNEAYSRLLRWVGDHGKPSVIARRGSVLRGRCAQIGEGLELWSTGPGRTERFDWTDFRPAYRSRSIHTLSPWELTEYEDGRGSVLSGLLAEPGVNVTFELQNLTETDGKFVEFAELRVSVAGIAYNARVLKKSVAPRFALLDPRGKSRYVCESDYWVRGVVRRIRPTRNHLTERDLIVTTVEAGNLTLDVLINPDCLRNGVHNGDCLSARVWLQGYLLGPEALLSLYEGLDPDYVMASAWRNLRREN